MQAQGDSIGVVPTVKNLPKVETPRSRFKQEELNTENRNIEVKPGLIRKISIRERDHRRGTGDDDSGKKSDVSASRSGTNTLKLPMPEKSNKRKHSRSSN